MSHSDDHMPPHLPQGERESVLSRRIMLKSALAAGLGLQFAWQAADAADEPTKVRPQVDDRFVFRSGERQGQMITQQDLPLGGPPVIAYPMDTKTGVVRNGSRLNQILLLRLAETELSEQTRAVAAEGIVAYSAICPHTGCDVSEWKDAHLICPCHASAFDPKNRARVMAGPAQRALAVLPLRLIDGTPTVAGPFAGRVGAQQK